MTNAHIEPHAETNIHMHPILDTFVFYFTSLPNAELATILTYIISFSFVSKLAINHVKKHFRNYSLMSCYEFVFKSVFIIVLRIICTLMCYIIYIHLRIECLKISYCIILMMVPLGQFVYYLMTDFKSIAVPSFLRLLASSRLSMFIFWGLSLAELLFILVEYELSLFLYPTHIMEYLVLTEGIVGTLHFIYLLYLPIAIRKPSVMLMQRTQLEDELHISIEPADSLGPKQLDLQPNSKIIDEAKKDKDNRYLKRLNNGQNAAEEGGPSSHEEMCEPEYVRVGIPYLLREDSAMNLEDHSLDRASTTRSSGKQEHEVYVTLPDNCMDTVENIYETIK